MNRPYKIKTDITQTYRLDIGQAAETEGGIHTEWSENSKGMRLGKEEMKKQPSLDVVKSNDLIRPTNNNFLLLTGRSS